MADNENDIKIKLTATDEASPTLKAAVDKLSASMQQANQAITANTGALKDSGNASKEHTGRTTELAAGFFLLKEAATVVYEAFEMVEHQLEKAIEASLENEKATNMMKGALVSTGQYTQVAAKDLEEYTHEIEKTTGATGAQVKSMLAQGVQMGLTIEKSKELEEASRKLAAANNTDVRSAFDMLRQSLAGHSRGLAMVLPQIKEFGAAQLMQGAAIDVVNQALTAQYNLYQNSFPASLDRAKGSVERVYVAVGNIITQNPLAVKAVQMFTDGMNYLEHAVESLGHWITENQATIEEYLVAFGKAVVVVGTAVAVFTLLTEGVGMLTVAFGALVSPLGLLTLAVAGLTIAFQKWPFLFDYIAGAAKVLFGGLIIAMEKIVGAVSTVVGLFNKDWAIALDNAQNKLKEFTETTFQSADASFEKGKKEQEAGQKAVVAHTQAKAAADAELESQSKLNKTLNDRAKMYAGFNVGTLEQRKALAAQVQERDEDLKKFTDYQNQKNRIAISKQQEQQMELSKFQAGAVKGAGGSEESDANAKVAIEAEQRKQAELQRMRNDNLISEDQYQEALLGSRQRAAEAQFQMDKSNAKARADLLGESEEGFQQRQQLAEEHFQLELQQKVERAQNEDATEAEISAMRADALAQHKQTMLDMEDKHNADIAKREELSGATVTATQKKYFREQEKAQADRIKSFASGVQMMTSIQAAANQTFEKLGDALIKNQKITASKFVGIFLEMLGRQIMQKGFGDLVMGIFPPNPVQLAVGAAEIAAGTAIGRLGVSMQGGQGDEGQDNVPQPLSGKSFVVSGGERIVQPSANKDLTNFLNSQKNGQSGGQTVVNITVQTTTENMAKDTVDALINELRRRSELGTPIINARGVVT